MLVPPTPVLETLRLDAVREYEPSQPFDQNSYMPLLELARDLFGVPVAFVTFVEQHTQLFPLRLGLELCDGSRDVSFCGHVVAREELLVVLDATLDPRFHDNPLVLGEPFIRFYAGMPLISPRGHVVGAFCLVDPKPHNGFSDTHRAQLRHVADLVMDKLELRRLELARQIGQTRFENVAATSPDGIICADADGRITFWNVAAKTMFGHEAAAVMGMPLDLIVPDRMRGHHQLGLRRVAEGAAPKLVGRTIELLAKRHDGSELPVELSLSMWREGTRTSFGAILRDISDRRLAEDRLHRLAHYDSVTGLPNQLVLRQRLDQLCQGIEPAGLLLLDLDGFKEINDDVGHALGDEVLRLVAERLVATVRATDTVARLGGDEFAIILFGVAGQQRAAEIATATIQALTTPITIDAHRVSVSGSIGVVSYPSDGSTTDELLSSADLALHQAKNDGRQCHRCFTTELRAAVDRARAYDTQLRRAYEEEEYEVFYQPQVRLSDGRMVGAEALLRWRHPVDGLLSPAAFMPALERRPLSAAVGGWVLRTACAQAAAWRASGAGDFRIGVNVFGSQFSAGNLVRTVQEALDDTGLPATALEIEITENIMLRHDESMIGPLREMRDSGVSIAFDDYGTGYASLSMLKRYPITRLKVDQTFVRGMCTCPEDIAIVRAILYLGRAFGFPIIAEGVESRQQATRLKRLGCDEVQGYLYGRPMPADEFAARFGIGDAMGIVTGLSNPVAMLASAG